MCYALLMELVVYRLQDEIPFTGFCAVHGDRNKSYMCIDSKNHHLARISSSPTVSFFCSLKHCSRSKQLRSPFSKPQYMSILSKG